MDVSCAVTAVPRPQVSRAAPVAAVGTLLRAIPLRGHDPTAYEDEEKKRIPAAIDRKIEGKEVISAEPVEPASGGQVIDLMDALRASLAKGGAKTKTVARKSKDADEVAAITLVLAYAASRLFEYFDRAVFVLSGHLVSGHTLKHLASAVAAFTLITVVIHHRDRRQFPRR